MKALPFLALAATSLPARSSVLTPSGHVMMEGLWDGGWMNGYGGIWMLVVIVAAVVAIVDLIINRK